MRDVANLPENIRIDEWRPAASGDSSLDRDLDMLSDVLHAVVHVGAGVSFVVPFSLEEARAFWVDKVLPGVGLERGAFSSPDRMPASSGPCNSIWPCPRISITGQKSPSSSCIRTHGAAALRGR